MATKIKNIEEVVQETINELEQNEEVKKEIYHTVDMGNGKVLLHTKGYEDGEYQRVSVNEKEYDIEISDNLGVIATGFSFSKYPAIQYLSF